MFWLGSDLKVHLISAPLPRAGMPSTLDCTCSHHPLFPAALKKSWLAPPQTPADRMESQAALVVFPSSATVLLHGLGQITEDSRPLVQKGYTESRLVCA